MALILWWSGFFYFLAALLVLDFKVLNREQLDSNSLNAFTKKYSLINLSFRVNVYILNRVHEGRLNFILDSISNGADSMMK